MEKPFSIIYDDFKREMASLIGNAGLPPSVIASVLQNYFTEVNNIAKNQYMIDKAQYEKMLSEQDDKNGD